MNNENKQFDLLDILGIFQTGLAVVNYQENLKQCTNDDIIKALDNQDKNYLKVIIYQNNEILKLLKKGDTNAQDNNQTHN